jgi:hypothetical protein
MELELIHDCLHPCGPRNPWWFKDMLAQPRLFHAAPRRSTSDGPVRTTIRDRGIEWDKLSGSLSITEKPPSATARISAGNKLRRCVRLRRCFRPQLAASLFPSPSLFPSRRQILGHGLP